MTDKTVVIIGGGLGGLFTGAILAKEGYKITVIEKNHVVGGGLQTFRRGGLVFETGMHILGGLRKGDSIYKICNYLGIMDKLNVRDADHDAMDTITYLSDGHSYNIPEGREQFTEYLISEFPHEEKGIRQYVDALYKLADEVDFFYLRTGSGTLWGHSEQFLWSADQLISYYVTDRKLRDLLGYMNPMYAGEEQHTPAYIHALINVLYIGGQSRFEGGSAKMAELLCEIILNAGGKLVLGESATHIHLDENHLVECVETNKGNHYSAQYYISSIHPQMLIKIVDEGAFKKSFVKRICEIPNTYSAFSLYLKFKPGTFPYINHTCYCQKDYGWIWKYGEYNPETWPQGFMYMTPAEVNQGPFANKMIVNCIMPFSVVKKWENTTVGRRGQEYEQWKKKHAERAIAMLEQLYPGFRDMVEDCWTASPLTIRDYYAQPDGSLYGVSRDCQNILASQVNVVTKVKNLFLTGQNVNLHGICGVPLTAVNTAEAVLGVNYVVNKINKYNDRYGKD